MRIWSVHEGPVNALVVTRDGKQILSGGEDGIIRRSPVRPGKGRVLAKLDPVHGLALADTALFASLATGAVMRIDLATGRHKKHGAALPGEAGPVAVTRDGALLAVGCSDARSVSLRDARGRELWSGRLTNVPTSLAFWPDGSMLLIGSWDGGVSLLDIATREHEVLRDFRAPSPLFAACIVQQLHIAAVGEGLAARQVGAVDQDLELDDPAYATTAIGSDLVVGGHDQCLRLVDFTTLSVYGELSLSDTEDGDQGEAPWYPRAPAQGPRTIRAIAAHPTESQVFVGVQDGSLVDVTLAEIRIAGQKRRKQAAAQARKAGSLVQALAAIDAAALKAWTSEAERVAKALGPGERARLRAALAKLHAALS
jgi:WD40 repeat protein